MLTTSKLREIANKALNNNKRICLLSENCLTTLNFSYRDYMEQFLDMLEDFGDGNNQCVIDRITGVIFTDCVEAE